MAPEGRRTVRFQDDTDSSASPSRGPSPTAPPESSSTASGSYSTSEPISTPPKAENSSEEPAQKLRARKPVEQTAASTRPRREEPICLLFDKFRDTLRDLCTKHARFIETLPDKFPESLERLMPGYPRATWDNVCSICKGFAPGTEPTAETIRYVIMAEMWRFLYEHVFCDVNGTMNRRASIDGFPVDNEYRLREAILEVFEVFEDRWQHEGPTPKRSDQYEYNIKRMCNMAFELRRRMLKFEAATFRFYAPGAIKGNELRFHLLQNRAERTTTVGSTDVEDDSRDVLRGTLCGGLLRDRRHVTSAHQQHECVRKAKIIVYRPAEGELVVYKKGLKDTI